MLYEDNRSFVTDLGASAYLSNEFIDRNDVQLLLTRAKYYYLSAFFLRISYDIIKKICEHSNMEKKVLIFNIGAPFLCNHYSHEFKEILPYVNVLIGNEEEFIQLADVLNYMKRDIKQIALFLYHKCRKVENPISKETLVIMTRGYRTSRQSYYDELTLHAECNKFDELEYFPKPESIKMNLAVLFEEKVLATSNPHSRRIDCSI
ncbi:pfkB family carbohydrate kinase [Popillia japonica]|uniref:Adenosine kinase n=1 Tax=Popillia japonica TaxID=7064 RepID=A0AAW1LX72_POPJA